MKSLVKIITVSIVAILMSSCNFDINFGPGVIGDGNVKTETREIIANFDKIKVSRGIDVVLIQNGTESLTIEADQNLLNVITTEFDKDHNMLRISANENIKSASSKKVILSINDLSSIATTSGANVQSETGLNTEKLTISSTSGSYVSLDVETNTLKINSTSGAGIIISGITERLNVASTSGSYIRANDLVAQNTSVSATSGASISINTQKELRASATSGASIKYKGNPKKVDKNSGVSGSIKKA